MRRILIVIAIVLALVVAGVLAVLFTQPRPKLTVTALGVIRSGNTRWVRLAVTNNSVGYITAAAGFEQVTDHGSTNRFVPYFTGELNGLAPGQGNIVHVLISNSPALWRPIIESHRPYTKTGRFIAMLRSKFARGRRIAATDQTFVFTGPWRTGTNAESGDVVGVTGK